jgi:hypothetical protein
MDINGAKALTKRLERNGRVEAQPVRAAPADVSEDAPPVYQWLGVSQAPPETLPVVAADEADAPGTSFFRRLGLSFR